MTNYGQSVIFNPEINFSKVRKFEFLKLRKLLFFITKTRQRISNKNTNKIEIVKKKKNVIKLITTF